MRDGLTGIYNRKSFVERMEAEVAEVRRLGGELSLLMVDVDNFGEFNDRFGQLPGDRALSFIAAQLARVSKPHGVVARWGDDQFAVCTPASRADALTRAERLRRSVATLPFSIAQTRVWLTVSIGVAFLSELDPSAKPASLLAVAEERMQGAKLGGRNQVRSM
jgi:two-component system cell cycle response regulator